MLVSGIFGRKNLRGIAVSLEFPEERFADSITPTGVTITNERRFMPAFLISILIDDKEVLFPIVGPRSTAVLYLNMVFQGRGIHTITDVVVASVFPFNFFTRYRRIPKYLELMIFPKLQRCSLSQLFSDQTRWKGDLSSDASGL